MLGRANDGASDGMVGPCAAEEVHQSRNLHQLPRHLPFDPLNRATTDANQSRHLQDAVPSLQLAPDGVLDLGRYLRTAELLPLLADTIQPCHDSIAEHRSSWSPNTDAIWIMVRPLGVEESIPCWSQYRQIPAASSSAKAFRHVEDASAQPINRPDRENVIATPHGILQHHVERRPLFPAFGTTDALVLVGLDDQPAAMPCQPCRDEPLILGGLIIASDSQVDRRANAIGVHSLPSELYRNDTTDPRFVELFVRNWCYASWLAVAAPPIQVGVVPQGVV
jgi:hypothetical protein